MEVEPRILSLRSWMSKQFSISFICFFVGILMLFWLRFLNLIKGKKTSLKQFYFYEHVLGVGNWKISSNQFYSHFIFEIRNSIFYQEIRNPKELVMLEFEGIRIPTLFKIILVVKDSIEAYYFKLVELRIPTCLRFDRVKNSINLVESRTPLRFGRVNW